MNQAERRFYLILELLKENGGAAGDYLGLTPSNGGGYVIPSGEQEQKALLRALMNIRGPYAASEEFLRIQDDYLKEVNLERGVTSIEEIAPCDKDKRLYLWRGDITTLKVDAIVNAANSQMLGCFVPLHKCIDNCIHTYAGIELRLECASLMNEQGHEEETGRCRITSAYNLPSKYILHTVGPIISTVAGPRDDALLASCYKSCLDKANEYNLESVAFCCISTGVFRFPQDRAAGVAIRTVRSWLDEHSSSTVKRIVFNVFGDRDYELYKSKLSSLS